MRMKLRWSPGIKSLCWNTNINIYQNAISRYTGICKTVTINKCYTLSWKNNLDCPRSWMSNNIIKCKEIT